MAHPLVDQFRFTRSEWQRGLVGVSADEATRHFGSMNCISWTVGHLAWHEQRSWLQRPQEKVLFPKLNELYGYGAPMSTPDRLVAEFEAALQQAPEATPEPIEPLPPPPAPAAAPQADVHGQRLAQAIDRVLQRKRQEIVDEILREMKEP